MIYIAAAFSAGLLTTEAKVANMKIDLLSDTVQNGSSRQNDRLIRHWCIIV